MGKENDNKKDKQNKGIKKKIVNAIDQDNNGKIDSTDIILISMKMPGIKVNREKFLRKEFSKSFPEKTVKMAIDTNPTQAGIPLENIDKVADEVIKFERNAVSGISTLLGVPGGVAMVATIPADIGQYYGYMLRAAQKLLYLYGFPDLGISDKDGGILDTETVNNLTVCLGIMYGVAAANRAIQAMAQALAKGVEKKLLQKALTKGAIYPIVKKVAKWFGVRMTKAVFAGFFKKAIPVVGGVVGGGITYATFKPCCNRLKNALRDTQLSNPDHVSSSEETELYNSIVNSEIEGEFKIIDLDEEDDLDASDYLDVADDPDE